MSVAFLVYNIFAVAVMALVDQPGETQEDINILTDAESESCHISQIRP